MNRLYGDFHRLGTGGWGQLKMYISPIAFGLLIGAGTYLLTQSWTDVIGMLVIGCAILVLNTKW